MANILEKEIIIVSAKTNKRCQGTQVMPYPNP